MIGVLYRYMSPHQSHNPSPNYEDDVFTVTVSDLGRVSIPAQIKKRLNLKAKDKVNFRVKHDQVYIEPVPMSLEAIAGSVMPRQPGKDIDQQIREAKEEWIAGKQYWGMEEVYADTNIFIRLLSGDNEAKYRACLRLFERVKNGEVRLLTSEMIVAEVVYVLASKRQYGLERGQIHRLLYPLLCLEGVVLPKRKVLLRALDHFVRYPKLDFEDCFIAADMKPHDITRLYSYDHGFDELDGVERVEPAW